jgi:hypothetical protein
MGSLGTSRDLESLRDALTVVACLLLSALIIALAVKQ